MALCSAAVKMNDISIIAVSLYTDNREQFISFTEVQHPANILTNNNIRQTLGAKIHSQPVAKPPKRTAT